MATSVQCALAYSFSQVTISHLSARGNVYFSEPSILAICPFPNVHRLAFLSVTHGAWKLSPIRFLISHNKQKWNKLKTSDFCGAVRRLKSLWNLKCRSIQRVTAEMNLHEQEQDCWAWELSVLGVPTLPMYFSFKNLTKLLHRYQRNPKLLGSRQVKEEPLK